MSLKTVSRVVNGEPEVRPETAARVEAAIERLGFRRNEVAWSLRNGRAGAVGLVIEDLANPFYSAIAGAVEDEAHDRGHALPIGSCEEDPARERALVLRLLRRWVDALLIVPAGADHRYPTGERPTAVFCADNRNTVGALRALRDAERPVGFDDFELAELLAVPVSVVRYDTAALGSISARLAYARVAGEAGPPRREVVPCELVARGSGEVAPA